MKKRTITFDPVPHTYTDEFGLNYKSVTTYLGEFEEEFDKPYWTMYKALERSGYKVVPRVHDRHIGVRVKKNIIYYSLPALYVGVLPLKITPFQIEKEWDDMTEESCIWGTDRHNFLEDSINLVYKTEKTEIQDIKDFNKDYKLCIRTVQELDMTPLRLIPEKIYEKLKVYIKNGWVLYAEKRVYCADHLLAGTTDLLLVKNKEIIIIDWKTNKHTLEFRSGYYKKVWNKEGTKKIKSDTFIEKDYRFKAPIDFIPLSKGNGYTLQLSTYAYMWELWGFKLKAIVLCHIQPKLDENKEPLLVNGKRIEMPPKFYPILYRKRAIKKLFLHRQKQLKEAA